MQAVSQQIDSLRRLGVLLLPVLIIVLTLDFIARSQNTQGSLYQAQAGLVQLGERELSNVPIPPPSQEVETVATLRLEPAPSFSLERQTQAHVTVSYLAAAGLHNQHMAHQDALMLAAAIKAQRLMWPPSKQRDSFNVPLSQAARINIESKVYYDMDHIKRFAQEEYGIEVVAVPAADFDKVPRGVHVALLDAKGETPLPGKKVALKRRTHKGFYDLQDLAKYVNQMIDDLADQHSDNSTLPQVQVSLKNPFGMLKSAPEDFAVPIFRNTPFAPNLRSLADQAVKAALNRTGSDSFNGLHLRVEADADTFHRRIGGECGFLVLHNREMEAVGFNGAEPLIVASGVFSLSSPTPANLEKMITYSTDIISNKYASKLLTKEMLLVPEQLESLGEEEKAAVDWLILKQAHLVVGWAASTFDQALQGYRSIEGKSKDSLRLVSIDAKIPEECE